MNEETVMTNIGDGLSLTVLAGYFFAGLPTIALLLTVIWTALRIWEMCTVRGWFRKKCNVSSE